MVVLIVCGGGQSSIAVVGSIPGSAYERDSVYTALATLRQRICEHEDGNEVGVCLQCTRRRGFIVRGLGISFNKPPTDLGDYR